ncbi:MAG: NPXTG-anchored protein [Oscillospiraceae bacterium]|nr:NPXTG-anchored protein [Oscillospiraceae bacterium]
MKLRKIIAGLAATAMAVSTMAVSAFAAQDVSGLENATAYLNINNADWGDFEATWTNAKITGDGDYVVKVEMAEAQDLAPFNALEVVNGETELGFEYVITVTSIKINGTEAKTGEGYTCSADGGAVTTRVNLYNEWNSPDAAATAGEDKHLDQRCADGDVTNKTATMVAKESIAGVESIEVAFTVSGLSTEEEPVPEEEPAPETNPDSGLVGLSVAGLAVAGAAVVATKKRK